MFQRKKAKSGRQVRIASITNYDVSEDVANLDHVYAQIQRDEAIIKSCEAKVTTLHRRTPLKKIIKQHQKNLKAHILSVEPLREDFRTQCKVQGHPLYLIRIYKAYRDALSICMQKINAERQQIDLLCAPDIETLQNEIKAQRYRALAKHMQRYYSRVCLQMINQKQPELDHEMKQCIELRYKKILAVYQADLKDKATLIQQINTEYQSSLEKIRDEWITLKNKLETYSHEVVRAEVQVKALYDDIQAMQKDLVRDYPFVENQMSKPEGYPEYIFNLANIIYLRLDDSTHHLKSNAKKEAAIFYAGQMQEAHRTYAQMYQELIYLNQSSFQQNKAALVKEMIVWQRILRKSTCGEVNLEAYPVVSTAEVSRVTANDWLVLSQQRAAFEQARMQDACLLFEREECNRKYTQPVKRFTDEIARQIQLLSAEQNNQDKQAVCHVLSKLHQRLEALSESYITKVFGVDEQRAKHEYITGVKEIVFEELHQKDGWKQIVNADETGELTRWLRNLVEPLLRWLSLSVVKSYGGFFAGPKEKALSAAMKEAELSLRVVK